MRTRFSHSPLVIAVITIFTTTMHVTMSKWTNRRPCLSDGWIDIRPGSEPWSGMRFANSERNSMMTSESMHNLCATRWRDGLDETLKYSLIS